LSLISDGVDALGEFLTCSSGVKVGGESGVHGGVLLGLESGLTDVGAADEGEEHLSGVVTERVGLWVVGDPTSILCSDLSDHLVVDGASKSARRMGSSECNDGADDG
jgi:hypothetical protein